MRVCMGVGVGVCVWVWCVLFLSWYPNLREFLAVIIHNLWLLVNYLTSWINYLFPLNVFEPIDLSVRLRPVALNMKYLSIKISILPSNRKEQISFFQLPLNNAGSDSHSINCPFCYSKINILICLETETFPPLSFSFPLFETSY